MARFINLLRWLTWVAWLLSAFLLPYYAYDAIVEAPRFVGYRITDWLIDGIAYVHYIPLAIAVLGSLLLAVLRRRSELAWRWRPMLVTLLPLNLLAVWGGISFLWSKDSPETALWEGLMLVLAMLGAWCVYQLAARRAEKPLIALLTVMLVINSVLAVGQAVKGGPLGLATFGEIDYKPEETFGVADTSYRGTGLTYHPNVLGGYLEIGLVMVAYAALETRSRRRRVLWLAAGVVLLAGLVATQSRSAMLGVGVSVIVLLVRAAFSPTVRPYLLSKRSLAAGAVIVVLGIGALFLPPVQRSFERFFSAVTNLNASSSRMLYMVNESIPIVQAYPITGKGIQQAVYGLIPFNPDAKQLLPAHNTFLATAVEVGLVGAGLLLLAVILTWKPLVNRAQTVPILLAAGMVGLFVCMLLDHYFWSDPRLTNLLLWWLAIIYTRIYLHKSVGFDL